MIKEWNINYKECLRCKGTLFRHRAKGYCQKCYHLSPLKRLYWKKYALTQSGKEIRRKCDRKWVESNKEKRKEIDRKSHKKRYIEDKASQILRGRLATKKIGIKSNIRVLKEYLIILEKNENKKI